MPPRPLFDLHFIIEDERLRNLPAASRGLVCAFYALANRSGDGYLGETRSGEAATPESVIYDLNYQHTISEKMISDIRAAGFLARDRGGWYVPAVKKKAKHRNNILRARMKKQTTQNNPGLRVIAKAILQEEGDRLL